jgi:hypothetical protein
VPGLTAGPEAECWISDCCAALHPAQHSRLAAGGPLHQLPGRPPICPQADPSRHVAPPSTPSALEQCSLWRTWAAGGAGGVPC